MRRTMPAIIVTLALSAGVARADALHDGGSAIRDCIIAAATVYRLPPAVLVILLNVEGGSLGRVTPNANGTVDIGPMQINQVWLTNVAAHWHAGIAATYNALRDDFCANVEAGAWILRQGLDEAPGDFWQGVGYYHSHDPQHKSAYLSAVLQQVLRLRTLGEHEDAAAGRPSPRTPQSAASTASAARN